MISEQIGRLDQAFNNGAFPKFIRYIRFPYFRGLTPETRIDFNFPITAFVGRNGGGKSSTLHALFGCPQMKSIGNFWFSTKVDPIEDPSTGDRHCLIYAYLNPNGESLEVIKTRIQKKSDPDYWEPSRPIKKYGMKALRGKRNPGIEMPVEYIDFRSVISAFSKYFYFHEPRKRTKQDYLRTKAKLLWSVISTKQPIPAKSGGKNISDAPEWFDQSALEALSEILGRQYIEVALIEHSLFGGVTSRGTSVYVKTAGLNYSEAFAGSGETAAAILVHRLSKVESNSLVLLDEPEMSLHPGAQKRLLAYLVRKALEKKLQVVFSTHSPSMIEGLPKSAIKLFTETPNGKTEVLSDINTAEAFFSIGHTEFTKITIICEDVLSKTLIELTLRGLKGLVEKNFHLEIAPGGATTLFRRVETYIQEPGIKRFVLLDGDQDRSEGIKPLDQRVPGEMDLPSLKADIKKLAGMDIKFFVDGGSTGANEQQQIDLMKDYINFYFKYLNFLPFKDPDEAIWNDDCAKAILRASGQEVAIDQVLAHTSPKARFGELSKVLSQESASEILGLHKQFIHAWISRNDESHQKLVKMLSSIPDLYPSLEQS